MIRRYEDKDYDAIRSLLQRCNLPVVTANELEGLGLIWEEAEKPVGFAWALIGNGKTVFLDHFCVDPDYRDKEKDSTGRSRIAYSLMLAMVTEMKKMGITRMLGILQNTESAISTARTYNTIGVKFSNPLYLVTANPSDIVDNILGLKNGR